MNWNENLSKTFPFLYHHKEVMVDLDLIDINTFALDKDILSVRAVYISIASSWILKYREPNLDR